MCKEERLCICIDRYYKRIFRKVQLKGQVCTCAMKKRLISYLKCARQAYRRLYSRHVHSRNHKLVVSEPRTFVRIERKLDANIERLLRLVKYAEIK